MARQTALDQLAERLGTLLRDEHRISVEHDALVGVLDDRRSAIADTLRIQPRSALRYLDSETVRAIAGSIAALATPDPAADLDPEAAVNAVTCAHYEPAADGLPALHLTPAGLLSDFLLADLLAADQVSLALEDPHAHCPPEHRAPGPHQHLLLHLNAGSEYGHENCLTTSSCIGCMPHLFDAVIEHGTGWIRRYVPQRHGWAGQVPFRLANSEDGVAALAEARGRLTPQPAT